jgi:hypothetical protein
LYGGYNKAKKLTRKDGILGMPPLIPSNPPMPKPELPSLLSNNEASVELMSLTGASGSLTDGTVTSAGAVSFGVRATMEVSMPGVGSFTVA